VVGVGGAGSRIANRILAVERASGRNLCNGNALLIGSTPTEFDEKEHVPEERRLLIGDTYGAVEGRGTDGDVERGAEVAREDRNEILRAFDMLEFFQVDGILLVAGLGGGTGGGAGSVVIDELKAVCDKPVYAVGVLPAASEGRDAAMAAARSLQSFVERADNVVLLDNETWQDEAPEGDYAEANRAVAERLVTLFAAGEFSGGTLAENRMDPSDIMRTLDTGGVSTIGYAATDVPRTGLVSRLLDHPWLDRLPWRDDEDEEEELSDAAKINKLVRRAARSTLTLPAEISSADRALIMLSGPEKSLSRKGFESGRYWLEKETDTVEVMAGDEPHNAASELTATVLFSNVTDVPRIEAMQAQALADADEDAPGPSDFEYGDESDPEGAAESDADASDVEEPKPPNQ
ncbi:MAG TPA: tubulin/FtsZ family protein, partial [Halobacteriales archaeon]|nr:tubulin/FtsZ family protein [Halobacteriales archaeon]